MRPRGPCCPSLSAVFLPTTWRRWTSYSPRPPQSHWRIPVAHATSWCWVSWRHGENRKGQKSLQYFNFFPMVDGNDMKWYFWFWYLLIGLSGCSSRCDCHHDLGLFVPQRSPHVLASECKFVTSMDGAQEDVKTKLMFWEYKDAWHKSGDGCTPSHSHRLIDHGLVHIKCFVCSPACLILYRQLTIVLYNIFFFVARHIM